jgi:glucosamine--fructose-6-phosphate aminotransferase (isomerizing)
MCSVLGCVGAKLCRDVLLSGLARLEYRGYDSAGIAFLTTQSNRLVSCRSVGGLQKLVSRLQIIGKDIDGLVGVGHTRWATHGEPSELNAHPQFDSSGRIAVVHNGIIENYLSLKQNLVVRGHEFASTTDTEVIARELEEALEFYSDVHAAVPHVVQKLHGAYAFLSVFEQLPGCILAVRRRSPLCIGASDEQIFLSSDVVAFPSGVSRVLFMPDESYAFVFQDKIELFDFQGRRLKVDMHPFSQTDSLLSMQGHESFMLKEIYEQRQAIADSVLLYQSLNNSLWDSCGILPDQVKRINKIQLFGCGSSWHAASIGKFFFEQIARIPTVVQLSSEMRYMEVIPEPQVWSFAISQSGETADTLEAIRVIKDLGPITTITNVASSSMVREADGFLLTKAGREISVASTKAFTAQVATLYWLAHRIALERGGISASQMASAEGDLFVCAQVLDNAIANYMQAVKILVKKFFMSCRTCIFLGRHVGHPLALEAALKLKEITYIFAQGFPAGELKHGPMALIDADTPVVVFSHADPLIYQKLVANAQEIKARGGQIVAFIFEGQSELESLANTSFVFPVTKPLLGPLVMTGLMQYFAYVVAKERGCPIDRPRNLAKSVTVE